MESFGELLETRVLLYCVASRKRVSYISRARKEKSYGHPQSLTINHPLAQKPAGRPLAELDSA